MSRRTALAAVACVALCGSARAFEFKADAFEGVFAKAAAAKNKTYRIHILTCKQEGENQSGVCLYDLSPSVSLGVVNARGKYIPNRVFLSWNGDRYGLKTLSDCVLILSEVVAPGHTDGSGMMLKSDMLRVVLENGTRLPTKVWTVGATVYRLEADPHLGSRDDVLFSAIDTTVD